MFLFTTRRLDPVTVGNKAPTPVQNLPLFSQSKQASKRYMTKMSKFRSQVHRLGLSHRQLQKHTIRLNSTATGTLASKPDSSASITARGTTAPVLNQSQQSLTSPSFEQPPAESKRLPRKVMPFSAFLTDTYSRHHDYLRISVTERCNLRCVYCMPEEGVQLSPESQNLTTPEIVFLSKLFVAQGVTKIRLTGGEPTVRKDIVDLVRQIGNLRSLGLRELCITTNGLSLRRKLDAMVEAGLTNINLSLDTLDPHKFTLITRRNGFDAVQKAIDRVFFLKKTGTPLRFKINCVVIKGLNDQEILQFAELGRDEDVEIRFIEYMPFDGNRWSRGKMFTYKDALDRLKEKYPEIYKVQDHPNDTSKTYKIPGFAGRVGFVTSMTEDFCGTCNRLRITSDGNLKVCLFGNAEVSLRDIMRSHNGNRPILDDMWTGGEMWRPHRAQEHTWDMDHEDPRQKMEAQLLEVIGHAVKRKKERHADLSTLQIAENRPMILIGG